MTFTKHDSGKPMLSRVPIEALNAVAKVLEFGSHKYDWDNWRKCEDVRRYHDAALRHIYDDVNGKLIDPESNQPHIAHAICSLMFVLGIRADGEKK